MKKWGFVVFLVLCSIYPAYKLYKKCNTSRADVAIYGPVVMADGIGRQAMELAQFLSRKYEVQLVSNCVSKKDMPKQGRELLKKKYNRTAPVAIVEDILWHPGRPLDYFFSNVSNSKQIRYAYSMLECTRIIPEWVLMLNLYFDAVVVPDPYLVDVYEKSGVTIPIFCIPLGIDIDDCLKAPLKQPKKQGPLVFACLGSGIERKNHKMAIQAFAKALGNNENAWFYINCRSAEPDVRESIIDEIAEQNCSNIRYTEIPLNKDAYIKFLSSVDCLVNLSKGEGFAIQPREAMALGIPVILTDNTAHETICSSGLVRSVPSNIPEPRYYFNPKLPDGEQFACALDDCVAAIRDVYLNYSKYANNAPIMRQWASNYNYKKLIRRYETIVRPKTISLGDVNEITEKGIVTTSPALVEKYRTLLKVK